ncbi:MAG TPA: YggS family pyridoxal phosphate-dependent enzyme, partial [Gemmatales bacterium]|nr:YggS family pyridoxal phosphate-dependent enzyme [Gemmatales bacterium]
MQQIEHACKKAGREPKEVQLVPVTKYVDVSTTRELYKLTQGPLGESRPQVIWEKSPAIPDAPWHLVGHLQRNKVARTLPLVDLIHSVDSQRLLECIDQEAGKLQKIQKVLLELHLTEEESKTGLGKDEWALIPDYLIPLQNICVVGLMTMAPLQGGLHEARRTFAELRRIRDQWQTRFNTPHKLSHLSMGMTNDFQEAIMEGATLVRIGSALFEGILS